MAYGLWHGRARRPYTFLIGRSRTRLPVAAKIALQMAGAMGGTPGSPTPAGGASLSTMCTRVGNAPADIRGIW